MATGSYKGDQYMVAFPLHSLHITNPFPLQSAQGGATFLCTKTAKRKSDSQKRKQKSNGAKEGLAFEFYPFRFVGETNRSDGGRGSEIQSN
jgi:hypothetical protein